MKATPRHAQRNQDRWVSGLLAGVAALLLVALGVLHYLTPQIRLLPATTNAFLARHAAERFAFLLPVIVAAWALGWKGGTFTLALALLIMLPRALWISPTPVDALFETAAAIAVGGLAIWAISAQARQKKLHQEAAARLDALNAVSLQITSVLDLDEILSRVLRIANELVGADGGGIALYDPDQASIRYPYLHNLPPELVDVAFPRGQGVAGEVTTTARPVLVENYQTHANAIPAFVAAGLISVVAVPIISGDRAFGALTLTSLSEDKRFAWTDVELLTGIGRQAAIAIENARLYEGMRGYARQVVQVQENERERIARELHDETIQTLIVISRRLDLLAAMPEPLSTGTLQLVHSTQELLRDTQQGIRRFIHGLRPSMLEHLGLLPSIRSLLNDLGSEHQIVVELEQTGEVRRLTPEKELALYRITQEALNNVRRHALATQVRVCLAFEPDRIRITVQDNGRGFVAPQEQPDLTSQQRLGLMGMDERARSQGGTVTQQSAPGQGTTVTVDVPI